VFRRTAALAVLALALTGCSSGTPSPSTQPSLSPSRVESGSPSGPSGGELFEVAYLVVSGTTTAARNVISGNVQIGVRISEPTASGNLVAGNLIGTDVTGFADLGNTFRGLRLDIKPRNLAKLLGILSDGVGRSSASRRDA